MQPSVDDTDPTPTQDEAAETNVANAHPTGAANPQAAELVAEETPTGEEAPFPLADAGEYYDGLWAGHPNYKCPYCSYATLEGSGAVEIHILTRIEQGSKRHQAALSKKEA